MKASKITPALLSALLLCTSASAADNNRKYVPGQDACLEISGRVSDIDKNDNKGFRVYLYEGLTITDSIEVDAKTTFRFLLKKNEQYSIRIAGEGYVPKLVSISTELPDGVDAKPAFRFHFDTELISESQAGELNADALDFPIALISYDKQKGWFDYKKKYTESIKKKIVTGH